MAGFGSRQLTFDTQTAPSVGPPAGLLDLYGAALETQRAQKNAFWIEDEREKAYDAHAAIVRAETGIDLPNPIRQKRSDLGLDRRPVGSFLYYALGGSEFLRQREDQYQAEIEKLAVQHPDKAGLLRPDMRPDQAVVDRAARAERNESDMGERRGGSWWLFTDPLALAAQFTGSMRGMIEDPANALTMGLGPMGRVGLGGRALAWSAVKNGVANAAVEAAQQPFVQSWRQRAGLESGLTHALGDIGMAFAFGGAVDLGVRAGYRGVGRARGWTPEIDADGGVIRWNNRTPANDAAPGGAPGAVATPEAPRVDVPDYPGRTARDLTPEDALDQSARTAPPTSRIRQAVDGDLDSLHMVAKEAGVDKDPAYRGARRAAEIDDALIPPPPKGMAPDAHQAALHQAARASIDPNEPPPFLPPREAEAVAAHLAGIDKLSEKGQAAVLEAGRRQEQLIALLRSEDGQQAEARLKTGTADPVDVAATLRDMPALDTADLPRTPGIEMGRDLARLSDEAFTRIENGHAPPEHGQVVARMVPNPHDHGAALDALARARPQDVAEARAVISDFLQRPNPAVHEAVLGVDRSGSIQAERFADPDTGLKMTRDDIDAIVDMWRYVQSQRAERDPETLSQWLLRTGRVQDQSGEISNILGGRARYLISGNGRTLDDAARAAWEAGFLRTQDRPTVRQFLEALDEDVRNSNIVRDAEATRAEDLAVARKMETELDKIGLGKVRSEREIYDHFRTDQGGGGTQSGQAIAGGAHRQSKGINDPAGPEAKAQTETLRRELTANLARPDMIDKLRLSLRTDKVEPLDMSPAARKARAEAMGFDTSKVFYHGTLTPFDAVNTQKFGSRFRYHPDKFGMVITDNRELASQYALDFGWDNEKAIGGAVKPLYSKAERPLVVDAAYMQKHHEDWAVFVKNSDQVEAWDNVGHLIVADAVAGNNDAIYFQAANNGELRLIASSNGIRSVNADFDPAKGDSATLMARLTSTEYTPAFARAQAQLRDDIIAQAVKTLPPSVRIKVEDRIRIGAYELNGYYSRRDNILAVALDAEADPTFRHERIHALRAHELFTDAEWRLLTERANKDGMRAEIGREDVAQYRHLYGRQIALDRIATRIDPELAKLGWDTLEPHLIKAGLYDPKDPRGSLTRAGLWDEARLTDMIDEEAVAKLAERWRTGERFGAKIDAVLERVVEFLHRVANALHGNGFQTVDDVFRRIETGEVGMRKHREHTLPGGAKVRGVLIRDLMASIKAFHGSPHDFDKFSLDKIGTGEGAQAFGHGLYFAENAKVAESYRNGLSGGEILAADGMPTGHADVDFELANRFGGNWEAFKRYHGGPLATSELARKIAELDARGGVTFKPAGSIYEVRLNLEQSDLLDWSAPLAEQPDAVRKLAQTMQRDLEAKVLGETDGVSDNYLHELTGADLLYEVQRKITGLRVTDEHALGAFEDVNSPAVTKVLQEYGLKGISYFDGQSRGTGAGTRNYVVFDDSLIEIVAKDGMPVDPLKADTTAAKRAGELGQMAEACKL